MEELEGKFSLTSLSYRRDVRMKKTQIFCGLGHNSGSSHTAFNYSLLMAKKNKKVLYVAVGNNINTSIYSFPSQFEIRKKDNIRNINMVSIEQMLDYQRTHSKDNSISVSSVFTKQLDVSWRWLTLDSEKNVLNTINPIEKYYDLIVVDLPSLSENMSLSELIKRTTEQPPIDVLSIRHSIVAMDRLLYLKQQRQIDNHTYICLTDYDPSGFMTYKKMVSWFKTYHVSVNKAKNSLHVRSIIYSNKKIFDQVELNSVPLIFLENKKIKFFDDFRHTLLKIEKKV